jgi:hypothetical protein
MEMRLFSMIDGEPVLRSTIAGLVLHRVSLAVLG